MLPSCRLTPNGCIQGRCVEWVQVCRCGRSKHVGAATPDHQVAVEASRGAHANAAQYLTLLVFVWLFVSI